MESKKTSFLVLLIVVMVISCGSNPQTVQTPASTPVAQPAVTQPTAQPAARPPVEEAFDPSVISKAEHDATMEEVKKFIDDLNRIIGSKNYNAWKNALSPEYFAEISSPANLNELSELPAMKTRRIVLKTPEDYFSYVFIPSRANSRVDDIEFFGKNRVKAFSINTTRAGEEQRLRLYDLEKIGNSWKIIN